MYKGMKRILLLSIALLSIVCLAIGCEDDKEQSVPTNSVEEFWTPNY